VKEALERMQKADARAWENEKRAKDLEAKLGELAKALQAEQGFRASLKEDPLKVLAQEGLPWEALVDRASMGRAGPDEKSDRLEKALGEFTKQVMGRVEQLEQHTKEKEEQASKMQEDYQLHMFGSDVRTEMERLNDAELAKSLAWLDALSPNGKASFTGPELKQKQEDYRQKTGRSLTASEAAAMLGKEVKDHRTQLLGNMAIRKAAADYLDLVLPDAQPAGSPPAPNLPGSPTLTLRDQQSSAGGGLGDLAGLSRAEIAARVKAAHGVKD
jgi:hypothetical protein